MEITWDPIALVNIVLCILIFVLGLLGYRKRARKLPLYIGIAFGIFGLSHILTLLGLKETLEAFLIIIRLVAYLMVVFASYQAVAKLRT